MKQFFAKVTLAAMVIFTLLSSASAQNRAIRGKVVDQNGLAVIGASVIAEGTTIGTVTDMDGNFSLFVPAGATLSVSSIGYTTVTLPVGNQTNFNITLQEDNEILEETVVIGYGVQRKSDLTGSVASVKEADLSFRSTSDAAAALQGKAA
ncbi:MAG: carboxypeptidase-like regulatory domain-containing protein, partial [Bacteroidales bacterium]|nr:carboxypeptidase-like regulatory domain-containing protein [Bacteroidales bacterium]